MASVLPDASLLKRDFFGTQVLSRGSRGISGQEFPSKGLRAPASMAARIRLARYGCRNKPFYRIMATDSRSRRDGKFLEILGYYNPVPVEDNGRRMGVNFERVKYWLSVGAKPSETVQRLLVRAGVFGDKASEDSAGPDQEKVPESSESANGASEASL